MKEYEMTKKLALFLSLLLIAMVGCTATTASRLTEGSVDVFKGKAKCDIKELFKGGRMPNIVVTTKGTVIVVHGAYDGQKKQWWDKGVQVRRSEDGGESWGKPITIAPVGKNAGGAIVDDSNGDVLVFVEQSIWPHNPTEQAIYRSSNDGKTWKKELPVIIADSQGRKPVLCMAEHGITLMHGKDKGRLIRPSRYFGETGDRVENYPVTFNNAVYSDDGGKTWQASAPFPEMGTGEGCIAELTDGRIYYNSRRHWDPPESTYDKQKRWEAWSYDGGVTWKDAAISKVLPDNGNKPGGGVLSGLIRLPVKGRDILLYSSCRPGKRGRDRVNVSVWASFDGGKTWPVMRQIWNCPSAYSSMAVGRSATPSEGWIYVMAEAGKSHRYGGAQVARFDLSWLLDGELTGDGKLPQ